MSWYVICFVVLVCVFVFPSFKKKNKKRKNKIEQSEIKRETKTEIKREIKKDETDDSFSDLFDKIFKTQEYNLGSSSSISSSHKPNSKQEKTVEKKMEERKPNNDTKQIKNESCSNKSEKKELTFAEKRAKGVYSTRGSVRVKGGLLPHYGSIGRLEIYYDGKKMPSLSGSRGKIQIYKVDGNLQVFYKNPSDIQDFEFLGLIVDMYKI